MKVSSDSIKLRAIRPEDVNFVLNAWLKSYRNSSVCRSIPNDQYYAGHQGLLRTILSSYGTNVTILTPANDDDHIIGFVVYNGVAPLLHYVYVKHSFRHFGFGRFLVNSVTSMAAPTTWSCTHICPRWEKISKSFNLIFDPYTVGINEPVPSVVPQQASKDLTSNT